MLTNFKIQEIHSEYARDIQKYQLQEISCENVDLSYLDKFLDEHDGDITLYDVDESSSDDDYAEQEKACRICARVDACVDQMDLLGLSYRDFY